MVRWVLGLQAYDLEIKHRPGAIHQNADCLSRLPMIAILSPEADRLYKSLDKPDLWKSELREIQESLKLLSQDVSRKNGSFYKKVSKVWIPYVKPSLRTSLIVEAHCLVGHSGVQKTMAY